MPGSTKGKAREQDHILQPFYLERLEDMSGVSGIGIVAVGVELPSGKCVVEWMKWPYSLSIHDNMDAVKAVHGHGGKTKVVQHAYNLNAPVGRHTDRQQ